MVTLGSITRPRTLERSNLSKRVCRLLTPPPLRRLTIQLSDLHSRKDTLKASIEANQNALAEMLDVAPASDRMLDRRASTQSADHVPPTGGRMMERRSSTQSADLHSKTKHMDLAAKVVPPPPKPHTRVVLGGPPCS